MTETNGEQPKADGHFERFDKFTRKLMVVPKKEIDIQEAKYQKRKRARKKRKSA